MQVDEYEKKEK